MPNWCNNTMKISHADPVMLKRAADAWNSGAFLQTLIPCPADLINTVSGHLGDGEEQKELVKKQQANIEKYGYPTWYEHNINEWGTKWDIGMEKDYGHPAKIVGNSFSVGFDSAWSPPCAAYEKLKDMGYLISAYYYEPGCDFCGRWVDGEDEIYEISHGGIPQDIALEMGIDEQEESEE